MNHAGFVTFLIWFFWIAVVALSVVAAILLYSVARDIVSLIRERMRK